MYQICTLQITPMFEVDAQLLEPGITLDFAQSERDLKEHFSTSKYTTAFYDSCVPSTKKETILSAKLPRAIIDNKLKWQCHGNLEQNRWQVKS